MKRVYIAGKLNALSVDYIKNMHHMMRTGELVKKLGVSVYVPCHDILQGLICGDYEYEDYFNNSQEWLKASDAVFVCSNWETSPGTKREIALANELRIPVFFTIEAMKAFLS